ncbi:catalase [Geodermatophilus sp. YIM 151500]|uniref:peroxidase family protein n=1 Tax=Geodermatophilus sp. YIM 151500 TaxID=2984531 RepID=UPI0021E4BD7D|nr:peroxidase family protein [Geodermatophilus sp. YIM 151500]MCV2489831.1 catalase [Geodermatophilus sp. YIM 151500]
MSATRTVPTSAMTAPWTEEYAGGSPEAERQLFDDLAREIMRVQRKNQRAASSRGVPHGVDRAFHAKATLAVADAELRFRDDLPEDLQAGFAQPGAEYSTVVRFSNAAGTGRPDYDKDLRGVALRMTVSDDEQHDLLMTNYPVSHARNAQQFVEFAVATAGGRLSQMVGLVLLVFRCGLRETVRMLGNIRRGRTRIGSVATQSYWSRGAIRWGGPLAVRYLLRPAEGTPPAPSPSRTDPAHLSHEVARRLADGDIRMELCVQRYRDRRSTPIEDTAIEWNEKGSPPEPVAVLTIRRRDVTTAEERAQAGLVEAMAFNPWNTTEDFKPLGNLNRARKAAYDAAAAHRRGERWRTDPPLRNRVLLGAADRVFSTVNRVISWHRLPLRLSVLNLTVFREVLRRENLIDTEEREAPPRARTVPPQPSEDDRVFRTFSGRANDLSDPEMGKVGATFGRNLRPVHHPEAVNEPNPITVSRELLVRNQFIPASSLNVLAAAWIQFQVHDWVNHARHPLGTHDVRVPLPKGMDGWVNVPGGAPEPCMRIAGNQTRGDAPGADQQPFGNDASHWWDGSEVYGSDPDIARSLRDGAGLKLTEGGYLPEDVSGMEVTGFNESWWLGLSGMHTLFAREHNVVCEALRSQYPRWDDERVYQTARLIVSALIAKIHTVEWTPAILGTRTLDVGMKANWSGPPARDWLTRLSVWLLDEHASVGIPKTKPDHHRVPYSLTEDFVTVYRMHPLIPDEYTFLDHRTGDVTGRCAFGDIQGPRADEQMRTLGLVDTLYSFGRAHPGAITLHNYPRALTDSERQGERIDLSVVDLVRTRMRGVPRYNEFRVGLHRPRVKRWEDLTADPQDAELLRQVYRGRIDDVDTMVGLFAEIPPPGFGFSDTAFRIFILMASRRLQSDRFLTVDFRPEVYSPLGMDWIERNSMTSVILRHCPELAGVLPRDRTAFAPWRPVGVR